MARAFNNLGDISLMEKKWDKAIDYFKECQKNADKVDDIDLKAWAQFNMAEAYIKKFDIKKAMVSLDEAIDVLEKLSDLVGLQGAYKNYGELYTIMMDWTRAEQYFRKALDLTAGQMIPFDEASLYKEFGRMLRDKGDIDAAEKELRTALDLYSKLGSRHEIEQVKHELDKLK